MPLPSADDNGVANPPSAHLQRGGGGDVEDAVDGIGNAVFPDQVLGTHGAVGADQQLDCDVDLPVTHGG